MLNDRISLQIIFGSNDMGNSSLTSHFSKERVRLDVANFMKEKSQA